MNFGTALIWLSFIGSLVATVYGVLYYRSGDYNMLTISRRAELIVLGLVTFCTILLTWYLYDVNLSYSYVFSHSAHDLEWYYRISALWAGREGSFLLWTWLVVLAMVMAQHMGPTRGQMELPAMNLTRIFSLMIATGFLLLLVVKDPFESSISVYGVVPSFGQGMNPLLRNPWMAIHPPILFIGYAAFTVPFAAAAAYILTDDPRWTLIARPWGRFAWTFLTLGIALGGFWAYGVLGWGAWYWSWDPVETSSFVPWVTGTAYLHAQTRFKHRSDYEFLAPALAIISFILVIFATFVTRSGLWASNHSWQELTLEGKMIAGLFALIILGSAYLLQKKARAA